MAEGAAHIACTPLRMDNQSIVANTPDGSEFDANFEGVFSAEVQTPLQDTAGMAQDFCRNLCLNLTSGPMLSFAGGPTGNLRLTFFSYGPLARTTASLTQKDYFLYLIWFSP